MKNKGNFFKDHVDTLAIIGVNLAGLAILISLSIANMSSIAAANSRMDQTNSRIDNTYNMIYEMIREGRH